MFRSISECVVGERGFEPPTSSTRTKRATKLRYSPTALLSIAESGARAKSGRLPIDTFSVAVTALRPIVSPRMEGKTL